MKSSNLYVFAFSALLFLSGCSLEASLSDLTSVVEKPLVEDLNRKEPDILFGETITTSAGTPGFEVRAVIGEISEKQSATVDGGWQVEGTFYE